MPHCQASVILTNKPSAMKKNIFCLLVPAILAGCGGASQGDLVLSVKNETDLERNDEMVEIPMEELLKRIPLSDEDQYVILDAEGTEVPWQITFDHNLMFPVHVGKHDSTAYKVIIGKPQEVAPVTYGRHYPERVDDIAWENDVCAYRCYGPALQESGEKAYGYDIWVKNTPLLVVEERYANELNPETTAQIAELKKTRRFDEANKLYRSVSYHVDHGNGLDCYKVGPTLGGGTAALLEGDNIHYPYCWANYEIIENGPLRFTIKLVYNPLAYKNDTIVETRILSLTKGSQLNKTILLYEGLTDTSPLAAGIVVHPENTDTFALDCEKKYIAYQDLTDNIHNDNGIIYVGIVSPTMKEARYLAFNPKEAAQRGASGHLLAISDIAPDDSLTYYWGSAWSKAGWKDLDEWKTYLDAYARKIASPLKVSYSY